MHLVKKQQQEDTTTITKEIDMTDNSKSLKTFSIPFDPAFSLHLSQENSTQNHGTTVWDSAKLLAFYLFDSFKKPSFEQVDKHNKTLQVKNFKKKCLELGSGCGLGGLLMASLGFDTILTDLPDVVDQVLTGNCDTAIDSIYSWWNILHHTYTDTIQLPKIKVESLNWFHPRQFDNNEKFDYILATDCIYAIELVEPLLKCISFYSTTNTIIYIAMERRDNSVVDGFIEKAQQFGFDTKMVLKKLFSTHQKLVCNEDVEIWKLRLKRRTNIYKV